MLNCIVVDDDEMSRKVVVHFIEKTNFLQLNKEFDNAMDAVHYLDEEHVDIIFLDVQMPEMSGMDFINALEKDVEIILITSEEKYAVEAFEKMVADAEQVCADLGLTYRINQLCTGDLGFGARITYDIEVWAPGCGEWLEVSSISNDGDFQARRANIRYRPEEGGRTRYVHTLNGSGLGMPRTMIAVLENYQRGAGHLAASTLRQQ